MEFVPGKIVLYDGSRDVMVVCYVANVEVVEMPDPWTRRTARKKSNKAVPPPPPPPDDRQVVIDGSFEPVPGAPPLWAR